MDNQSNGTDDSAAEGQYPQNPRGPRIGARGPSSFDRANQLTGSFVVWAIPFAAKAPGIELHSKRAPPTSLSAAGN